MNVELSLAMMDAEHYNEQRRLSKNSLSRRQTTTNLMEGLSPYLIPKIKNLVHCDSSSTEIPSSPETTHTYHQNYDIDFDPVLSGVCMEDTAANDSDDDQLNDDDFDNDQLNNNLILLNELFSSKEEQDSIPLHPYTNISTNEFCVKLIGTFRQANLCKTYSSDILKLIHLALPQPNNLPTSLNTLLGYIHVENLFIKRKVCLLCQCDIQYTAVTCIKCKSNDSTQFAEIYDVDCITVLSEIVERHFLDIVKYREKILFEKTDAINNDIPFQKVYRAFLKTIFHEPFISTILHLDGIPLGKSTKLTLWLLSCSILELPPDLRNQRRNMVILSMWVGVRQPIIRIWLHECIQRLKKLKTIGFTIRGQNWMLYFIGIIADCPAMKLALNHIGNNGYYSCWLCKIKGVHTANKRQYHFEEAPRMRNIKSYLNESKEAEVIGEKVYGHLGMSLFHEILDVPLPQSIIMDYMHISLLRHTRCVVLQIYEKITAKRRLEIDNKLRFQKFPHTFNRKLKPISAGHPKASEIKNLLLYALIPIFYEYLSIDKAAHIALFVCAIRMLHGPKYFGCKTSVLAHELITVYYKDHHKYYNNLHNLVLHLHIHYAMQYENYGSLNNTNCFAQESLLGKFAKNKHGTRYWGDLLAHYFSIDFALQKTINQQNVDNSKRIDGAFDLSKLSMNNIEQLSKWHEHVCGCSQTATCVIIYHRCVLRNQIYHSRNYPKRQSTISYFVQYINDDRDSLFGTIEYFFTFKNDTFAFINNYPNQKLFSDIFASSSYHKLLSKCINSYFYILKAGGSLFHYVPVERILNLCVIFEKDNFITVTPISNTYEHD